jgi:adenylate cyclase
MRCVVRFRTREPEVRTLAVPAGTTLLEAARRAGLPIARGCGGEGLCGRCGLRVLAGGDALGAPDAAEERAKQRNRVPPELRLACRAELRGSVEVSAAYW